MMRTRGQLRWVSLVGLALAASGLATSQQRVEVTYIEESAATLRGLDKVTGQARDFEVTVGEPVRFGRLEIVLRACFRASACDTPESAAYVEITELPNPRATDGRTGRPREVFAGWMMASSPGLNAMDHAVYDVWAITCKIAAPTAGDCAPPTPAAELPGLGAPFELAPATEDAPGTVAEDAPPPVEPAPVGQ